MLFLIALSALMAAMLCYGRLGGPGLSPCMYPQYDNFKEENMKRTLAIVLSLVLAFGAFSLTQATEPQTYTFVVGTVEAEAGETGVLVPVTMPNLAAIEVKIEYDPEILTYAGYEADAFVTVNDDKPGQLHLTVVHHESNYGTETAFCLKFDVSENFIGTAPITVIEVGSAATIIDERTIDVPASNVIPTSGAITVPEVVTYEVTFVDGLTDETIDTQTVEEGMDAVPPEPPVHEGYVFAGWEGDYTNITENTTITARYEEEGVETFTVTAQAGEGGTVSPATQTVAAGSSATITITPDEGYEISSITVNGEKVVLADNVDVTKEYKYVIEEVGADLAVKVEFAKTGSEPTPTPPVEDPDPPTAGAISAIGLAIGMIAVGAGTVVFRKRSK